MPDECCHQDALGNHHPQCSRAISLGLPRWPEEVGPAADDGPQLSGAEDERRVEATAPAPTGAPRLARLFRAHDGDKVIFDGVEWFTGEVTLFWHEGNASYVSHHRRFDPDVHGVSPEQVEHLSVVDRGALVEKLTQALG